MHKLIYFLLILILASCANTTERQWSLSSPDREIEGTVELDDKGHLSFHLSLNGNAVVEKTSLGIVRQDQVFDSLILVNAGGITIGIDEYELATGKQLQHKAEYHEMVLEMKNGTGARLDVVFRAYDEGFAFRYVFPEQSDTLYTVTHELTSFELPAGKAWLQPYDTISAYSPAYERNWEGPMEIGAEAPGSEGWCFPALFEVNNSWLLLTESDLDDNFYGSHLKQDDENSMIYKVSPPEETEGFGYGNAFAISSMPWQMPWRVFITGNNPGAIAESNLTTHLAKPSILDDVAWVVPGRASWAWWSGFLDDTNDTPEKLKKFIDFAAEMGWEYSLIDAGWESRKGLVLEEMVAYAAQRNVRLLLWYNIGGPVNRVNAGPRDRMFDPELRRAEMKRISDLGIAGIKVDFFSSDKQDYIKLYLDLLKDAAEYKIMVNFHGSTIPRGWTRTYPNLVSMESVKGAEGYIYHSDFRDKGPVHKAILPFTRNVIGPMDYTPVTFSSSYVPHKTTYAFQLALSVLFESGIQHYADQVDKYRSMPEQVLTLMRNVPAAWDDTRYLSGYPGVDVVLARKKGDSWYIAGINAQEIEKSFDVDFSFLDNNMQWKLLLIADGQENTEFKINESLVNNESQLNINTLPVGGFIMHLTPVSK